MSTLDIERLPKIRRFETNDGRLTVHLDNDRVLSVPLTWYPRLASASPHERDHWEVFAQGTAIEWPDLDEHIGIDGLIASRRSQESEHSFRRWFENRKA